MKERRKYMKRGKRAREVYSNECVSRRETERKKGNSL